MSPSRFTTDLIGYAAATMTTVSFVPQLLRVLHRRSARDISLGMFLFFSTGTASWLLYGVLVRSWPVVVANAVTTLLALAILTLKLHYDGRERLATASDPVGPAPATAEEAR